MPGRSETITVSAQELEALRALLGSQRIPLAADIAAVLEQKGLIMRGWDAIHVLTEDGEAALRGLGSLIKRR